MTGRIIDISRSLDGKQRVTLELDQDFRDQYLQLKDQLLDVEIQKHRDKASRNARGYLHVLINKIARAKGVSESEVKRDLVLEYGALAKDDDGQNIGFKLPAKTNVDKLWRYTKCFNSRWENGTLFNFYLVYKETKHYDSKEMADLIDGAIWEARQLGIETDPPEVLERYRKEWSRL
ncbi:hypothetical protein EI53_01880 [Fusobacterium naviforme]|nr:hypothetical protein F7P78_06850 [Fusobacterium naviforme]PSL09096.1 hypothetical protein EI53_01880 [Fusobacterium naviforme]STO27720.1 Uncharacterised protein [Fusobacterium naviforme]